MAARPTIFGSLQHFEKGGVEVIDDNPKNYVFSNVFEVASKAKPYEKVCVGKNLQFVVEVLRAEGDSPWFVCGHDEAALAMDGEIEVHYRKPARPIVSPDKQGSVRLDGEPEGEDMGWVKLRRGHMALLSKGNAYRFRSLSPGVIMIQTIQGDYTIEKWADICQTA